LLYVKLDILITHLLIIYLPRLQEILVSQKAMNTIVEVSSIGVDKSLKIQRKKSSSSITTSSTSDDEEFRGHVIRTAVP